MGKPGSGASKTPHLRIPMRQIFTIRFSWSECVPDLVLQANKAAGQDYYLGSAGRNSVSKIQVPGVANPSLLLCHGQIPRGWVSQIPLWSPLCEIRIGAPIKWPTMLGETRCLPGFSFPTGGTRGSGQTSLAWGGAVWSACSCSSYPSSAVCLGLCDAGGASASPLCSTILSVVSCSWIDVNCSCEGSETTYVAILVTSYLYLPRYSWEV